MADVDYLIVDDLSPDEQQRIFAKITVDENTGCWIWNGSRDPHYGLIWYRGRNEKVHRFMWAWKVGPLPTGIAARRLTQLDHVCRNRACCNPAHLRIVTQRENTTNNTGPFAMNAIKTHCKRGHEFEIQPGTGVVRYCRVCDVERHKARLSGPQREYWLAKAREARHRYYWKNQERAVAYQCEWRRKRQLQNKGEG